MTVSKTKERSDSGSRRNSVTLTKAREGKKLEQEQSRRRNISGESGSGAVGEVRAKEQGKYKPVQVLERQKSQPAVEKPPRFGGVPSKSIKPQLPASSSFPMLPMFQPPPAPSTSFTSFASPFSYSGPPPSSSPFESALTYRTREPPTKPPELGARPKAGPRLSSSPEDIYLSDEDEQLKDGVPQDTRSLLQEGLIQGSGSATPGSQTPKWEEVGTSKDADKEMDAMWRQTQYFDMGMGPLKPPEEERTSPSSDGKRDTNGFIHCTVCETVHTTTGDFVRHCRSDKHRDNSVWAEKLGQPEALGGQIVGGWETWGREGRGGGSPWESGLQDYKTISKPSSRSNTPGAEEEVVRLKQELEREKTARVKAEKEVVSLESGKKMLQKQSLIVENTLKAEESKVAEYKGLSERLSERLRRQEFEAKFGTSNNDSTKTEAGNMASEVDRMRIHELETQLATEVNKSEGNRKVIQKLKEKVDRAEKAAQKERDSRLLAEKTAELAEKAKASEEIKRRNLESQLAKGLVRVKEAEDKAKEEKGRRMAAELGWATHREAFEAKAKEINKDQSDLVATVNKLVREKREVEEKVEAHKAQVVEKLQAQIFLGEDSCLKILQDSEEIMKTSILKAVQTNGEIDGHEEVKRIFKVVNSALQGAGVGEQTMDPKMGQLLAKTFKTGLEEMREGAKDDVINSLEGAEANGLVDEELAELKEDAFDLLGDTDNEYKESIKSSDEIEDNTAEEKAKPEKNVVNIASSDEEVEFSKLTKHDNNESNDHDDMRADGSGLQSRGEQTKQGIQTEPANDDVIKINEETENNEDHFDVRNVVDGSRNVREQEDGSRSQSRSSNQDTESFKLSLCEDEDPDGLDRFPKLGLDHEIDPYLGSPTVSRAGSIQEEEVEEKEAGDAEQELEGVKVALQGADDVLEGAKELLESYDCTEAQKEPLPGLEANLSCSSSPATSSSAWPADLTDSTSGLGSEPLSESGDQARLCCLESNVTELQHMLVSLGNTVRSLSNQVGGTIHA